MVFKVIVKIKNKRLQKNEKTFTSIFGIFATVGVST